MTDHSPISQTQLPTDSEFLTVEQAANLLQVPVSWIYRQTRRNALPGMRRIGKYVRIYRPEFLAWLTARSDDGNCRKRIKTE
jgi:excisionase family DNA binding protein